jgi:nicotinamide mononucleotide adenylyltransferase
MRTVEPEADHRHRDDANPFTYFERLAMVRAALDEAGVDPQRIAIVPFPISEPERFAHYVPPEAVHVVRTYSGWEARKAQRLRAAGYRVVEIPGPQPKPVTSTEIRRRLEAGEPLDGLVPPAVARWLASRAAPLAVPQ